MKLIKRIFKLDKNNSEKLATIPKSSSDEVSRGFKNISSTLVLLISAPLLAILITSHVFHSYQVDGLSMASTLQSGDRLIVNKFPKTIANLSGSTYLPSRGDIIVFDKPRQLSASGGIKHLIKRVIALPGERITVRDGVVTVYNDEILSGFNPDENTDYSKSISRTTGNVDITVGQEEVFVMGDNRSNSTDSRSFGPINTSAVVGTAELRFLPTDAMRRL